MIHKLSSLSILIPAYNDDATIDQVMTEAIAVGRRVARKFEIVVTNDGSTDMTGPRLVTLAKRYRTLEAKMYSKERRMTGRGLVTIITHRANQGYGRTIKELYYAGKGEWLFTIPGDYQIGALELLKILRQYNFSLSSSGLTRGSSLGKMDSRRSLPRTLLRGGNDKKAMMPDMILGWRVQRKDPAHRLLSSWVYNTLLRLLFGVTLHDANSVRLMRRAILKDIRLASDSAFVDAELVIRAKRLGFTATEVPIAHRARGDGRSGGGNQWGTMWATVREMIQFNIYCHPRA